MAVCPRSAIIMVEDEEGFLYPFINDKLCIKCHLCIGTCPCRFYR
jgi:ferredoxin